MMQKSDQKVVQREVSFLLYNKVRNVREKFKAVTSKIKLMEFWKTLL